MNFRSTEVVVDGPLTWVGRRRYFLKSVRGSESEGRKIRAEKRTLAPGCSNLRHFPYQQIRRPTERWTEVLFAAIFLREVAPRSSCLVGGHFAGAQADT